MAIGSQFNAAPWPGRASREVAFESTGHLVYVTARRQKLDVLTLLAIQPLIQEVRVGVGLIFQQERVVNSIFLG